MELPWIIWLIVTILGFIVLTNLNSAIDTAKLFNKKELIVRLENTKRFLHGLYPTLVFGILIINLFFLEK